MTAGLDQLAEVCARLGFEERHRNALIESLKTFRLHRQSPNDFALRMSSERLARLRASSKSLLILATCAEADTGALPFLVDDEDTEVSLFLDTIQNSQLLRKAAAAIDRAIEENPVTKASAKVEIRSRFLANLAVIYEDVTGRAATVTRNSVARSISGDFIDFVRAAHRTAIPKESPPSPAVIEHWTDDWRLRRGTEARLLREILRIGG